MKRNLLKRVFNLVLVGLLLAGCSPAAPAPTEARVTPQTQNPTPGPTRTSFSTAPLPPTPAPAISRSFAAFRLQPVLGTPAIHHEPIDPNMGNVLVPLVLSPEQLQRLAGSGVVASPGDYPEFHDLYNQTSNANLPVFVTSDALLHAYHLTFDRTLSLLEEGVLLGRLQDFNRALLEQVEMQYEQLKGSDWEDPARRLLAFIAVGSKLADPDFQVPDPVADLADAELALIEAASGPQPSPIFPLLAYGEDYSQYLPRGHYTESEQLKAYFKAMMWYGRMTFRLSDPQDSEVGRTETRMALLLALAVRDGKLGSDAALDLWKDLYDPTAFLVGRSDDLTVEAYQAVMDDVYGPDADLSAVADDAKLDAFIAAANELPAPRILGLISDDYKTLEAVKGLRLMGQRFLPDAYIFQELIHPKVDGRRLPSGLDVMAVMGSERAATWLTQDATTQNPDYAPQSRKLMDWIGGLDQGDWVETVYNGWLYALRPLLAAPGEGYPSFMQSTAWQDKQLNAALGSWAELKHDTLLYAKQPYGGLGGGGCGQPAPPTPVAAQNYVEPVPEVFARIAALAEMSRQGLEERGLLQLLPKEEGEVSLSDRLESLTSKAVDFKGMAEKELQGLPLTDEEQGKLRVFGGYLSGVVTWANGGGPELDPAAVIADVATDPTTQQVLEVGVGNVNELYVVAPIPQPDGSLALTVARGGIFSYYEFPSAKRMTDEDWRAQVKNGQAPGQPAFTSGFSVPQAASLDIQKVIYRFQLNWVRSVYYTVGSGGEDVDCEPISQPDFIVPVSDAVRQQAQEAIDALRAQSQYEGRQWISTDYLSVEPSAQGSTITVTVRETWSDYLVTYEGNNPFAWYTRGQPEPVTGRRGPYTIDVTYVLRRLAAPVNGYQWSVVSFTESTPRPAWANP